MHEILANLAGVAFWATGIALLKRRWPTEEGRRLAARSMVCLVVTTALVLGHTYAYRLVPTGEPGLLMAVVSVRPVMLASIMEPTGLPGLYHGWTCLHAACTQHHGVADRKRSSRGSGTEAGHAEEEDNANRCGSDRCNRVGLRAGHIGFGRKCPDGVGRTFGGCGATHGSVTQVTDAEGMAATYDHDLLGRKTDEIADAAQSGLGIKVTWKHDQWDGVDAVYYEVVEAREDGSTRQP